ncbi:putative ATP-binding cassette sub-family F member 3 like protein [Astathelohania contejeani]|uniref:ATP-binding cassette sub-family F member 3 like protein n=1 Tax=Astathelohania contejeani TaxID=164912 RepID=A0ABQ7HYR6_9MICR|nr:putative ATP-binding cassette sub-family F member 3 like protein [Thelohania contejeani]
MEEKNLVTNLKNPASLGYITKLLSFPFTTQEEALDCFSPYLHDPKLIIPFLKISPPLAEIVPLESPFQLEQIKKTVKRNEKTKIETIRDEYSESSSEPVNTDIPPYDGDVTLTGMTLWIRGKKILDDASLSIIRGRRYGLIGRNGIGKTTLLKAIRRHEFGIPAGLRIHLVRQEKKRSQKSVIEYILQDSESDDDYREIVGILEGLGFTKEMMEGPTTALSGGWMVRVALAKALFLSPDLLLLDEPTNMLDLQTIVWLEEKIKKMDCTVIVVSHDRDFLNQVVTDTIHLTDFQLDIYKGNYNNFIKQLAIRRKNQEAEYKAQMAEREHLQSFIDRFRANAKRAALVQSKIKILEKLPVLKPIKCDPIIKFKFEESSIHGVLLDLQEVGFGYNKELVLEGINLKILHDSRIVIVGPNGAGKSTLLKLLAGVNEPTHGTLISHPALKPGYFTQHHVDHLQLNRGALEFLMQDGAREEDCRRAMARFGLHCDTQLIGTLSGGQKSRLAFTKMSMSRPNLLILDEPTNHLDIESIDALASCVNEYQGGVVCVSHDMNFVEAVFKEILICDRKTIKYYKGSIRDYRNSLAKKAK